MQKLHASSSFSALANVPFRQLWIASLASGTAVAADQTAARWMLNHLSGSAFVISLLSTMAALPFWFSLCRLGYWPMRWTEDPCCRLSTCGKRWWRARWPYWDFSVS